MRQHNAREAMGTWSNIREKLEQKTIELDPATIFPWYCGHPVVTGNAAKALYSQMKIHSLTGTAVLSLGGDESFYGITRIYVPSDKVDEFNKGAVPSASMAATPNEKKRLKKIWKMAGLNEIVNDDGSITYTFRTDIFARKHLKRTPKTITTNPPPVVDRMAIEFLMD